MALRLSQPQPASSSLPPPSSSSSSSTSTSFQTISFSFHPHHPPSFHHKTTTASRTFTGRLSRSRVSSGGEDTQLGVTSTAEEETKQPEPDPDPQVLEQISQIKRVLELLKKNRDMLFSEVKLTIMIEDPREVERRRLLGIDDMDGPTREEMAEVLEEVNEGKIPTDRIALQMLAEEMVQWPNLEVEAQKKGPRKSLYAKATDTGVDPQVAAKRLNIDWDSAAEIEEADASDEPEVPKLLGYGALYLVSAFPVIIVLLDGTAIHGFQNVIRTKLLPLACSMYYGAVDREADGAHENFVHVLSSVQNLNEIGYSTIEKTKMLIKESLQKERQISVDPVSMIESESSSSPPPPIIKPPSVNGMFRPPPPLIPTKYKFLSNSLPSSASSSPRISSAFMKNKVKNLNQVSPPSISSLARQHSVALTRLAQLQEKHLQRSKSCGEGRASAPSDDFDLWLTNVNGSSHNLRQNSTSCAAESNKMYEHNRSGKEAYKSYDEEFKCGALCLFLPGFGKGKPVRARKEEREITHVVSQRVSLEKFECGSWTSSAIVNDHDADGDSSNLFFDLPLELIRTNVNDANSPVSSAFVFDKDRKGVLKNGSSKGAAGSKSSDSSRHVRFSSSSPRSYPTSPPSPCITPRLRKAREDFNAFLEAQSA